MEAQSRLYLRGGAQALRVLGVRKMIGGAVSKRSASGGAAASTSSFVATG